MDWRIGRDAPNRCELCNTDGERATQLQHPMRAGARLRRGMGSLARSRDARLNSLLHDHRLGCQRLDGTLIHDRMPVLLEEKDFDAWFHGTLGAEALKPAAESALREWTVSPRLNRTGVGDDDPTIIEPTAINPTTPN
jgi:hypothetical protein